MRRTTLLLSMVLLSGTLDAQPATFPMKLGEAVSTYFSGFNSPTNPNAGLNVNAPVVSVFDVSDPLADSASPGTHWSARRFHNEVAFQASPQPGPAHEWTARNLGQVFGITLDDATPPNIYLTTTTTYGLFKDSTTNLPMTGTFGPGGPGGVYRLSGTNGAISVFATLPNASIANPASGPGLGDIAYDRVNRQFFVSNFYDGKIYRLAGAGHSSNLTPGTILDSYDFGFSNLGINDTLVDQAPTYSSANMNPASGFRPLGRRPWAVQVHGGRLYFSIWAMDHRAVATSSQNTIWSVPITAGSGAFAGLATLEITLSRPLSNPAGIAFSYPVSDIAFSVAGRMLIAERTMAVGDIGPFSPATGHKSRVLEYAGGSGNWGAPQVFHVGGGPAYIPNVRSNSEGGVDYGYQLFNYRKDTPPSARECDATVWATGELILGWGTTRVYGLQGIPASGNSYTAADPPAYSPASYAIDVGGQGLNSFLDKLRIGDVEVYRQSCFPDACLTVTNMRVLCANDGTGDYFITFTFKNLTQQTIHHVYLTGLSSGIANPNYTPVGPVPPNGIGTVGPIRISGATGGSLTFTLSIYNQELEECCATRVTVELPRCDCSQITESSGPICPMFPGFGYPYFFTLQNLFPGPVGYVLLTPETPSTATFLPNVIDLTATPIGQGASANLLTSIGNVQPGERVCFLISTQCDSLEGCCTIRQCVTIPRCFIDVGEPVPFDHTTIQYNGRRLVFDNPAGDPGVRFPLPGDVEAVDLEWLPIEGSYAEGSFVEQRLRGSVDGSADKLVASMRTIRAGEGSELRTSFAGLNATRVRYEFYRGGVLVGYQNGASAEAAAIVNAGSSMPTTDAHFVVSGFVPAGQEGAASCSGPGVGCIFAGYTFNDPLPFRVAGFTEVFQANEVRVFPDNGTGFVIRPSALEFVAHGPTRITITEVRLRADCNDNSVDDAEDIDDGVSFDADRDGRPDECESGTGSAASLNTGYDQFAGVLLPFGAGDDDWHVVSPGTERPANVVANPHRNWPAALPLTRWISVDADRGSSLPGVTQLAFERCFCLAAGAEDITLDLQLRADNEASVFVNGQKIAGPGGELFGNPLIVQRTGTIGDGLFVAGQNCVRVEVNDLGFFTGLNAAGSVSVTGETCAADND